MSETREDIAPQSLDILQTFVWWGAHKILRLCGAISLLVFILSLSNLTDLLAWENSRRFASSPLEPSGKDKFRKGSSGDLAKRRLFSQATILLFLRRPFQWCRWFFVDGPCEKMKKPWKGLLCLSFITLTSTKTSIQITHSGIFSFSHNRLAGPPWKS